MKLKKDDGSRFLGPLADFGGNGAAAAAEMEDEDENEAD